MDRFVNLTWSLTVDRFADRFVDRFADLSLDVFVDPFLLRSTAASVVARVGCPIFADTMGNC